MTEKRYHIYAQNKCIYHSLTEEEFSDVWRTLNYFVEIATSIDKKDLQYEEILFERNISTTSSY